MVAFNTRTKYVQLNLKNIILNKLNKIKTLFIKSIIKGRINKNLCVTRWNQMTPVSADWKIINGGTIVCLCECLCEYLCLCEWERQIFPWSRSGFEWNCWVWSTGDWVWLRLHQPLSSSKPDLVWLSLTELVEQNVWGLDPSLVYLPMCPWSRLFHLCFSELWNASRIRVAVVSKNSWTLK